MRLPLLTAFALTAAACAPTGSPGVSGDPDIASGRCFRIGQVHNFNVSGDDAYIRTNQADVYRLVSSGDCFDQGTTSLTVERHLGVGQTLCVGEEARVRVGRATSTPVVCIARVEGPITDSSVSGLPARQR